MNRLTERDEFGNADIVGVDGADLQLNLAFDEFNLVTEALNRLAAYEDAGLTPEDVMGLAQAKQDGRLVVLPCKVGDTVYYNTCYGRTLETEVRTFFCGHPSHKSEPVNIVMIRTTECDLDMSKFGKTVFLTREEAESALAARDGGPKQSGS